MNFDPFALTLLQPAEAGTVGGGVWTKRPSHSSIRDARRSLPKRGLPFRRARSVSEDPIGVQPAPATWMAAQPSDEGAFVRAASEPAREVETEQKPSIWKREVSFKRSRRAEADEPAAEVEAEVEPEPVAVVEREPEAVVEESSKPSIWKREVSFRRSRSERPEPEVTLPAWAFEEPLVEQPQVEQPQVEQPLAEQPQAEQPAAETTLEPEPASQFLWPEAHEPAVEAEVEPEPAWQFVEPQLEAEESVPESATADTAAPSIWKREISFRRRPSADAAGQEPLEPGFEPAPAEQPHAYEAEEEPVRADEPRPSIWKREISFGRREPADDAPTREPELELPEWARSATQDAAPAEQPAHESRHDELPAEQAAAEDSGLWADVAAPADPVAAPAPQPAAAFEPADVEAQHEPAPPKRRSFRRGGDRQQPEPAAKRAKHSGRGVKIVGLQLGASQIAAAHVRNNGTTELLKVARMPLEKGVVVGGEVRDPDLLAEALRTFFKANKLPKRGVRLGIASNRVGVRTLDVSGVTDPKLLPNAVRFRAQEVLPIPLSDAVLDYRVLDETYDDEGEVHRRVLVAFAYRELVDRYLSACRKAGVRLVGIDLEGFALLRALVDPTQAAARPAGAAVVTAALGHDRSIVSVSDGTTCEFTRVIEWGGSALDTAVARILALTPSQAEPIKRALTLDSAGVIPEGLNEEQASRARKAMLHEVNAFARELVSSLQFYQAQPGSLDIAEILVTGGTAQMPGLVEELQRLTGVGVLRGDPLARVTPGKRIRKDDQLGSVALAIGLGIED